MVAGYLAISTILLYLGLATEAESECWQHIMQNWKMFLLSTLTIGLVTEFANVFSSSIGGSIIYLGPCTVSLQCSLAIGWLLLIGLALLFSYILIKYTHIRFISAYVLSWIGVGVIMELINSLIWNIWHYPKTIWTVFDVFGLGFGILAIPIGYGGAGLLTYLGYILLFKLIRLFRTHDR